MATHYFDKWESQVRKGILEFILMVTLAEREYYGYELITEIKNKTTMDISEGTIYPLLNRLKKEEMVTSRWIEYESGIPRKYYKLTDKGSEAIVSMKDYWTSLSLSIEKMMVNK